MFLLAFLVATSAEAASTPDLTTTFIAPSGAAVYQSAMWQVKASNVGNRDAASTVLTVSLPPTNTSPTVHVMGTLGAKSASCSLSGTTLTCSLGTLRKGTSSTIYFYISLPESAGTLDFSATASTTTGESNTANNGSSAVANLSNFTPTFSGEVDVDNRHCTGTNLESFFECELYPSSISSHVATFHTDGSITFPLEPGYGGAWSVSGTELSFYYDDGTNVVAEFVGYGVDSSCWEGLTTFPGSTYVSPYEVCL